MSNPPELEAAAGIAVSRFRQILIWPLLLKFHRGGFSGDQVLSECAESLKDQWDPIDIVAERCGEHAPYEEIVYFHLFVRDFLYGDARTKSPSMHAYRRRAKVRSVSFVLGVDQPKCYESLVERVELYVFDTAIALFVIEVDHPVKRREGDGPTEQVPLNEVEMILDEFRRAYPPYWRDHKDRPSSPQRIPMQVTWNLDKGGKSEAFKPNRGKMVEDVKKGAEPPIAPHWGELLQPLVPYEGGTPEDQREGTLSVQQVEDERIPSMCYLAFDDPSRLTKGDMVRLALLDGPGRSETLPYSRSFLKDFDDRYCYDAFWDITTEGVSDHSGKVSSKAEPWLTSRYMCCGYGFTVIGKDDSDDAHPFYTNETDGILFHFRHHYFKIGLIAHFHRASLLMFSDRLSEAVKVLESSAGGPDRYDELREEVRTIREEFLRFRSRYWFDELSNQLQARLLFDLWSDHLQTRKLFAQVLDEVKTINEVLDARQQEEQTAATVRLTVAGTIGVVLTLGFAALQLIDAESRAAWLYPVTFIICILFLLFVVSASVPLGKMFEILARKGAPYWRPLIQDINECFSVPSESDHREQES